MADKKPTRIGKFFLMVDKIIEGYAIGLLAFLIINVFVAVIMRRLLGHMFPWSEEISLLCLTWFSFMGIAIGFREELHLGMDMFDHVLPKKLLLVWDRAIDVVVFGFGAYLVYFGTQFTLNMAGSRLAMTGWPNEVQYIVMPITGVLTCVYSILRLCGHDLRRYNKIDEDAPGQSKETESHV
jgi:TRAP-type C4-dicarboxylate transport system permease small subunit